MKVQQEAVNFRRTAYTALSEVDNAMEKRLNADEQRERLLQSLQLGEQRLALTGAATAPERWIIRPC